MDVSIDLVRSPKVEKNEGNASSELGTSSSSSSSTDLVKNTRDARDTEVNVVEHSVGLGSFFSTVGFMSVVLIIALDNYIIGMRVILFVSFLSLRGVVNALPKLVTAFNDLGLVGWYGSSYFLTLTLFQPAFGQLCTSIRQKLYICSPSPPSRLAPSSAHLRLHRLLSLLVDLCLEPLQLGFGVEHSH